MILRRISVNSLFIFYQFLAMPRITSNTHRLVVISPLMKIIQSVTHTYSLVSELDLILEEQGKSIGHQSKILTDVFAKQ